MAGEAENKKIAKLDFDVNNAKKSLDEINDKLKKISESSEKYAKKIGQNIGGTISAAINIDVSDVDGKLLDVSNLSKNHLSKTTSVVIQENAKRRTSDNNYANHVKKSAIDVETTRQKEMIKTSEVLKREHAKQAKSVETLSDKISNYAKTYLIYQGFNQLKHAITETIEEMVELEYQMVSIDRVLNENSLNINNYRDELIQLAYDYGNSMNNVTDVALRLAQAGYDSNEVLALTEKTLLALNTAELDATEATSDMVAVMAQWGLRTGTAKEQADQYAAIIDKVNKVADRYPTTSADLLEALKKTSSAFNLAGASIDETIALITAAEVASQRGGKAIGTALSNITQQLKDEGRLTIAESLGLDFYTDETKTQFKDIVEIFTEMSEKMEELKNAGKENSVEMQNLLSIFTVFRRNVGASLLGEMSGEDSEYLEILETSINSLGYSVLENSKHMETAKAAQAQFNATLLKLKTEIWDGGLEDVFRSMLLLGTNLAEGIGWLTKHFGALPVVIGTVVLAISALNKNMRVAKTVQVQTADGTKVMTRQYNDWVLKIKQVIAEIKKQNSTVELSNKGQQKVRVNLKGMSKDLTSYAAKTAAATLKTIALEAATLALNAAMTMGLSVAITAIVSALDSWIHQQDKVVEQMAEMQEASKEEADAMGDRIEQLKAYGEEYESIMKKATRDENDDARIYEIQENIVKLLGDKAEGIELVNKLTAEEKGIVLGVNDAYEEQIDIINKIALEEQIEQANKLGETMATSLAKFNMDEKDIKSMSIHKALQEIGVDTSNLINEMFSLNNIMTTFSDSAGDFERAFETLSSEQKTELLREWKQQFLDVINNSKEFSGNLKAVEKAYGNVGDMLGVYGVNQDNVTNASKEWAQVTLEALASYMSFNDIITSAEELEEILTAIQYKDYGKLYQIGEYLDAAGIKYSTEDLHTLIEYVDILGIKLQDFFPEFVDDINEANGATETWETSLAQLTKELSGYASQYEILKNAQDEYNATGQLTISTFSNIINNDLLSYLTFVDGKLQINAQSMLDLAESKKIDKIESLEAAAAADIQALAEGDLESISNTAKVAIGAVGNSSETTGNKMQTATSKVLNFAAGLQAVVDASKGKLGEGVDVNTFTKQANQIIGAYQEIANSISNLNISSPSYTPQSTRGGSSSSSYDAEKAAKEAEKAAEEEYKQKLNLFTDYIDEMEREEQRWVKKQKDLGVLSNEDERYIIQQRISRYQKYLAKIKEMTWLSTEDRLKLEKEYTEEIEDLQLDYMKLLKDELEDEIDAIEKANKEKIKSIEDTADKRIDKLKEDNKTAIELIEKEADAQIEALKAVEKENDRIRAKEEYERNRQAHLDDISYWEQRTGREAQEALMEARKRLEELDRDWEQQLEDWEIEDKIAKIEEERDAKIEAIEAEEERTIESIETTRDAEIAAIEAAQEREIEALQKVYDAKVKMYSETSQIIYDASVIESQALYNAYKTNFIDPISSELQKMYAQAPAPAAVEKTYETYTIKRGDTLSAIAKKYGTTVSKLMEANPYITNANMIYAGKTLQIPKFHEGGIVGGNQEAFALLKPNEVILKPEWAEGINRLAKMAKQDNSPINNSTVIEVSGDLVRIDANIKNKTDAEYLTRKVEKMLKDKFNIKK